MIIKEKVEREEIEYVVIKYKDTQKVAGHFRQAIEEDIKRNQILFSLSSNGELCFVIVDTDITKYGGFQAEGCKYEFDNYEWLIPISRY